eukprot:m.276370 g.276370  ORF g.276370 m.276370 type:complete len:62 (-) comp22865_c3_seq6:219-404(-)
MKLASLFSPIFFCLSFIRLFVLFFSRLEQMNPWSSLHLFFSPQQRIFFFDVGFSPLHQMNP